MERHNRNFKCLMTTTGFALGFFIPYIIMRIANDTAVIDKLDSIENYNTWIITNSLTGRNKGNKTKWYLPSELDNLVDFADVGDLVEIDRVGFQHWAVYVGPMQFTGNQKVGQGGKSLYTDNVLSNFTLVVTKLGPFCMKELEPYVVHFGLDTDSSSKNHGEKLSSKLKINFNRLQKVVGKKSRVRINNKRDLKVGRKPLEDVDILKKRIQEVLNEDVQYNVFNLNCEGFAEYCRYGKKASLQTSFIVGVVLCVGCSRVFYQDMLGRVATTEELTVAASILELIYFAVIRIEQPVELILHGSMIFYTALQYYKWISTETPSPHYTTWFMSSLASYLIFVAHLKMAGFVVVLCYTLYWCGLAYTVCGIRLPTVLFMIGMAYTIPLSEFTCIVFGCEFPPCFYLIMLNCLFALVRRSIVIWICFLIAFLADILSFFPSRLIVMLVVFSLWDLYWYLQRIFN